MPTTTFRRKAVAFGLAMTKNTPLAPSFHEKQLLALYIWGALTIDQVLEELGGNPSIAPSHAPIAGNLPSSANLPGANGFCATTKPCRHD